MNHRIRQLFIALTLGFFSIGAHAAPKTGFFDGTGVFSAPGFAIKDDPCHLARFEFRVEMDQFHVPGGYFLCKNIQIGLLSDVILDIKDGKLLLNDRQVGTWSNEQVQYEATDEKAQVKYRFYWQQSSETQAQIRYEMMSASETAARYSFTGKIQATELD